MKQNPLEGVKSALKLSDVVANWEEISSLHTLDELELRFTLLKISPELAVQLIQTQEQNRKPSPGRTLEYARRIEQDEWTISDAIKFDENGHLIDGQHRLGGVAKSGIATVFPVVAGYPTESQSVIDIGFNRTVAQIGQIQGLNVTTHHISMVRSFFLALPNSQPNRGALTSPQKVLDLLQTHQESIEFGLKCFGQERIRYAPIRSVVARAWYHENRKRLEEFLCVLDTGFSNGPEDNAAITLRNAYLKARASKAAGSGLERQEMMYKAVGAVESFLAREDRRQARAKTTLKWKIAGVDA